MEELSSKVRALFAGLGLIVRTVETLSGESARVILTDGAAYFIAISPEGIWVKEPGDQGQFYPYRSALPEVSGGKNSNLDLRVPTPGRVTKIFVSEGSTLLAGVPVLKIESMKMEIDLVAPRKLKVKSVLTAEGEFVKNGQIVVSFTEADLDS